MIYQMRLSIPLIVISMFNSGRCPGFLVLIKTDLDLQKELKKTFLLVNVQEKDSMVRRIKQIL